MEIFANVDVCIGLFLTIVTITWSAKTIIRELKRK